MANTGLLILTNPTKIVKLLPAIKKHVIKTLYIQYFPEKSILVSGNCSLTSQIPRGPNYSQVVANIYALTSSISNCLDIRVLLSSLKANVQVINTKRPVELVIFDQTYTNNDANTFMQDYLGNISMGCKFITLSEKENDYEEPLNKQSNDVDKVYNHVVLGGTFDRLHNGHKIFISQAILRCNEKLTVGVTSTNMIKSKILWELIEPCQQRMSHLKEFTEDVEPNIKYNIVEIFDMYGPTIEDPNMDMIVVSEETKRGGEKVNDERVKKNLRSLKVFVVSLAEDLSRSEHEEVKISSSNHRIRLLGRRLKKPNLDSKPLKPYIIGLTGGIASGKSSIAQKLQNLGAGLINCDIVAHTLYEPGKKCYNSIIETFGREYLTPDGQIDRKMLGQLVFNDKAQLEKLNKLMWPGILEETERLIAELHSKGFEIVVVEAAVLIQAGWQSTCHEIWASIITRDEAIKRLMERNKLNEEDAKNRISVQPSNQVQFDNAHVVFSTMWSHEVTQQQVERAWKEMKTDLQNLQQN